MADTLHIEIAGRRRNWWSTAQADYAEIPGCDGYMGILPGHAALLSELAHGKLTLTTGGKTESFVVFSGGYVEVRDNHVRVLADGVE